MNLGCTIDTIPLLQISTIAAETDTILTKFVIPCRSTVVLVSEKFFAIKLFLATNAYKRVHIVIGLIENTFRFVYAVFLHFPKQLFDSDDILTFKSFCAGQLRPMVEFWGGGSNGSYINNNGHNCTAR